MENEKSYRIILTEKMGDNMGEDDDINNILNNMNTIPLPALRIILKDQEEQLAHTKEVIESREKEDKSKIKLWDVVRAIYATDNYNNRCNLIFIDENSSEDILLYSPSTCHSFYHGKHNYEKVPNKVAMAPSSYRSPNFYNERCLSAPRSFDKFEKDMSPCGVDNRWPHSIASLTIEDIVE